MKVLFKNIPIGITAPELANFIESSFPEKDDIHIAISSIEMLEMQDNFTHPIEQFGVVMISPAEQAKLIIKALDGCVLEQYQIIVREYLIRTIADQRQVKVFDSSDNFLKKRENKRREKNSLLITRQEKNRRADERRTEKEVLEKNILIDQRIKERRIKDRRKHNLVYSRRI